MTCVYWRLCPGAAEGGLISKQVNEKILYYTEKATVGYRNWFVDDDQVVINLRPDTPAPRTSHVRLPRPPRFREQNPV